ncbi:hypothetical protein C5S36_10280 [Candidatus Methanophagaceae archaeon]|nr:hypothetical protein C5S36_10280 [Methanophagales archaeon]
MKGSCFGETEEQVRQMHKSSRKSAKVFHEKDATLIAEKVCVLGTVCWRLVGRDG